MKSTSTGRVVALLVRPAQAATTADVAELTLDVEQGTIGDHSTHARRQVTFLSQEAWQAATQQIGRDVPWQARRANVLVSGLDLRDSIGRRLHVGDCVVEIKGETKPCGVMDEAAMGLREALTPEWRGGAYGAVLEGGVIRAGSTAYFE